MAVSGDGVAWCREQAFRPAGGDFQGIGVFRSDVFRGERERKAPALAIIVSMSPPGYPSAWLHPCRARFRFTWQAHCNSGSGNGQPKSDLCDRVVDFALSRRSAAPRRGVRFPSRAGASGSHHLPWALPRVLQAIPKIKRAAGGNGWRAGRGRGGVCSKDASSAFVRDRRGSAIAASSAGRRRGNGRGGRRSRDTGRRRRANRNATGKAGVTGSASESRKPPADRSRSGSREGNH